MGKPFCLVILVACGKKSPHDTLKRGRISECHIYKWNTFFKRASSSMCSNTPYKICPESSDSLWISSTSCLQSCGNIQILFCNCTNPARFNNLRTLLRNGAYLSGMSKAAIRHFPSHRFSRRSKRFFSTESPRALRPARVILSRFPRDWIKPSSERCSIARFRRYRSVARSWARRIITRVERDESKKPYNKSPELNSCSISR